MGLRSGLARTRRYKRCVGRAYDLRIDVNGRKFEPAIAHVCSDGFTKAALLDRYVRSEGVDLVDVLIDISYAMAAANARNDPFRYCRRHR